jgi:hypothetical protein
MDEPHGVRAQAAMGASRPKKAQPGQKPAKDDGKPDISRDRTHHSVRQKPARSRRDLEPQFSVELIRPLMASNQFHAISARRPRQTDRENALQRSGVASRTVSRRCVTKTMEPGNMRLNARYGVSAVREQCARSAGASKWPRRNLNLPLAAGPRVRHIRADGAVAEWLKAAVC